MHKERIRPSLADLQRDYDQLAFPELSQGEAPAAKVTRTKPPLVAGSSSQSLPRAHVSAPAPPKPKSRFALQREREAAERARADQGLQRFQLDLEGDHADMGPSMSKLIGQVVEREAGEVRPPSFASLSPGKVEERTQTGFPVSSKMPTGTGQLVSRPTRQTPPSPLPAIEVEALPSMLLSVSKENEGVLASMSEAEILEEQRAIKESMGLSDGVLRMLMERGKKKATLNANEMQVTRPSMRTAEVPTPAVAEGEDEEGSPEFIRRHFFPNEPANGNLDWMKPSPPSDFAASSPSFSLLGQLLSTTSKTPPHSSLDDHHVSSSSSFTLQSLLTLAGSAVASQRSTAFLVLHRVLSTSSNATSFSPKEWHEFRLSAASKAGYALRDNHPSVEANALVLLAFLLASSSPTVLSSKRLLVEGAEVPPTVLSSFLDTEPFSALASLLSASSLPASSHPHILQVLSHLVRLSTSASPTLRAAVLDPLLSTPNLLEALSRRLIALPWPPSSEPSPSPNAISFFSLVAKSSRAAARALWERKLAEAPLRFLAILPWEMQAIPAQSLAYELLASSLEYWTTLARYGIGTALRTHAASLLAPLIGAESRVQGQLFELLRIWTVAAIDPHVTDHDILWSHVEDWPEAAIAAHEAGSSLAGAWGLLAAWAEGSKINKGGRGSQEREWLLGKVRNDFAEGGWARMRVAKALEGAGNDQAELASAALALSAACDDNSTPWTPTLLSFRPEFVDAVVDSLLGRKSFSPACTRVLVLLLPHASESRRFGATLRVIRRLSAGDEVAARDLTSWVMRQVEARIAPAQSALPLAHLSPFFLHAIVASSGGRVTSPLYPTPRDIKLTTIQHPFASSEPLLSSDWPLVVLDELLRSGSSPVINQLPENWDGSELGLVKNSLKLMEAVAVEAPPQPEVLVYDLIKVFMLEKDNTTGASPGAETDLFRDPDIQASMVALLQPLTLGQQPSPQQKAPDTRTQGFTLEGISALVSSAPFYTLFTDLVGLYDSISLGDPIFGTVLLPPLAMAYPIDFRLLLWIDYAHVLRTIKVDARGAITESPGLTALASFLYPIETNEALLGAYVAALVTKSVTPEHQPFLFLVALHHVTSTLFAATPSPTTKRMADSIVKQGSRSLVTILLAYNQQEELQFPPHCYHSLDCDGRKVKLEGLLSPEGVDKLASLLG